jgi:hypothetical protein
VDLAQHVRRDRLRRLTPAGWPRPKAAWRGKRLPVPWIVPPPEWVTMDPERGIQSVEDRLCQVCGEGHDAGGEVVIFLDGMPRDAETFEEVPVGYELGTDPGEWSADKLVLLARDQAILHDRCARLAVGTCPHLKRAAAGNRLFAFAGPISAIFHRTTEEGRPTRLYLRGGAARVWLMPAKPEP